MWNLSGFNRCGKGLPESQDFKSQNSNNAVRDDIYGEIHGNIKDENRKQFLNCLYEVDPNKCGGTERCFKLVSFFFT